VAGEGVTVRRLGGDELEVRGLTAAQVGEVAAGAGIVLHELVGHKASLEDAFMRLTGGELEYHAGSLEDGSAQQVAA
jgi:ABC-2 type transport system ATP-binding protein